MNLAFVLAGRKGALYFFSHALLPHLRRKSSSELKHVEMEAIWKLAFETSVLSLDKCDTPRPPQMGKEHEENVRYSGLQN